MQPRSEHTFHIPVMGTAFTVDSPLRVARWGIASTMSIVDDHLVESMRRWWLEREGAPYEAIGPREPDARARRIEAWLDYVAAKVEDQVTALRGGSFETGGDLSRYFELLPEGPSKDLYRSMREADDEAIRARLQSELRERVRPGRIEVNVMAKVDRDRDAPDRSDAVAAVRGFASSRARAALVLSAGLNPRVYGAMAGLDAFRRRAAGTFEKEIVLKVSDFRSAQIQGRFLAKKGLWVSEYRIESGINCGGHAFISDGRTLGRVLEDFRARRNELGEGLLPLFNKALTAKGLPVHATPPTVRVTVQGGIGTAEEDRFLRAHYGVDGTGWGTPFLMVPEAVLVDEATLAELAAARPGDIRLGDGSPFGVPFWSLTTSPGEDDRRERLAAGRPGTSCPKGYLAFQKEFGDTPLCSASRGYQRRKRAQLDEADARTRRGLLPTLDAKLCLCRDLAGTAERITGENPAATPVVCAGPNLAGFDRSRSLEEMVDHVYGRRPLPLPDRPHVLVREIELYAEWLEREARRVETGVSGRTGEDLETVRRHLGEGIDDCRRMAREGGLVLTSDDVARLARLEARLRPDRRAEAPAA